ncbi:MAG: GCN5-related N-acetyltransferase [Burkholderiales bacterium]|jgi:GNAT superfamily N-acetyltransferase|nr:GCN5-related N-acetyltransferase [Burkholderiales bacterium]
MVIAIRKVKVEDADIISDLISELGYPIPIQNMKIRLETYINLNNHHAYVAIVNNKVVGVISFSIIEWLHINGKSTRVTALVIDKQQQRKGIGTALLNYTENISITLGCDNIELTSSLRRVESGAHDFYKSRGYINMLQDKAYFRKTLNKN